MYKQPPGRNQRSKGIKVKHVLQFSLLLAVCFWLIYQVKRSHDKKREFDVSDARTLLQRESSDGFVKLGRKGIGVLLEGTQSKNVKHDELEEEEEQEAAGEVGEIKSEEDELEGMRAEGKMDRVVGGEDDEIDEDDEREKLDEVDKEEDVVDGEREDAVEDEAREIETEEAHGRSEKEISVEESDHDVDNEVNEAREEHYKADDASSAVTHNTTQVAATENEDKWLENSKERPQKVLEEEIKENNSEETNEGEIEKGKGLEVGAGGMTGGDHQFNTTTPIAKERVLDNSWNVSPLNETVTKGFNNSHSMNITLEVMAENRENDPELDNNSAIPTTNGTSAEVSHFHVGSNSTDSGEPREADLNSDHFPNPSDNGTQLSASGNISKSENSVDEGSKPNDDESWAIQNGKIKDGNTGANNGSDAVLESVVAQNRLEDDQHNPFESRVEKDVHKELDILPEL